MPKIFAPAHLHQHIIDAVVAASVPAGGVEVTIHSHLIHVHQGTDYRGVYAAYLAAEDDEAALADRIDWACMYSPT
jgi:hypothetical protein